MPDLMGLVVAVLVGLVSVPVCIVGMLEVSAVLSLTSALGLDPQGH